MNVITFLFTDNTVKHCGAEWLGDWGHGLLGWSDFVGLDSGKYSILSDY